MIKYSKQRELILNNLSDRYDHPTADMVYESIRKELPSISLGTVYRNLKFLVENGQVLSLKLGDGKEHFDGHVTPHYHFICSECGEIEDLFLDNINICKTASTSCQGEIHGQFTYFYGLCKKCKVAHNS